MNNDDNYDEETTCLNSVNITSNVRAPGEYKYYYCGENNSSSDKSFLSFSTMWYTTNISEEKFLLSSCYNETYTSYIYYCPIKHLYNIYVYKNIIDYKSENISLKPIQLIHMQPSYNAKDIKIGTNDINNTNKLPSINIIVKIFFGADNYLLLNEFDKRIILIDIFNGKFITLFNNKETKTTEPLYNIINTFDENYIFEGEERVRTYVFLSIKYTEKKITYYQYRFIIIEKDIFENNYFFLHQIDLDLGDGEPLGLEIARIPKKVNKSNYEGTGIEDLVKNLEEEKNNQWFFIFCFLSNKKIFQLITNYNRLSLYQVLRFMNQCVTIKSENQAAKGNKPSITTIGYIKKDNIKYSEENSSEILDNSNENEKEEKIEIQQKPFFWSTSILVWIEKKMVAPCVKIFLNLNTKRLSALILFFEVGAVVTLPFNYNDSPEEIKEKITITLNEIQIDKMNNNYNGNNNNNKNNDIPPFNSNSQIYKFEERYVYKTNTVCALTYKYLILAIENHVRIYDLYTNENLFKYTFYKEIINSFMIFNNIGFTFMMTWNKIFKIIFTTRLQIFSEKNIITESKVNINTYEPSGLNYPIFENSPEDIWKSYCRNLNIDNLQQTQINTQKCEICNMDAEYYCSDCKLKYYCCQEHFMYDYNYMHFFECQFVQFFRRKDIINIKNKEDRYLILYNELIKLCGRILNYIFRQISVAKDCHLYLDMLLNLITLLDNFGFNINYSEFCSVNLFPTNDKQKPEKVLFFQECMYFYVQLQLLKCTFTSKCKLYNLTDCYLKIIKNDIIPKLTPKTNKRIIALKCDKLKKKNILNNAFFKRFGSPIFFNLKKIYFNSEELLDYRKIFYSENNDTFDIVENYIMKQLMALSILVKFKIKLHSSIDVKDIFVDITLMFDYHFRENKTTKNIVPYCYFSISFYLVEIGKVPQTVKLLKKMVSSFTEKTDNRLKALTYYNLGILQYALGEFKIGIHNLETSYKQIVDNSLSEKYKQRAMISLGMAYLNQPNLFKAYVLIQKLINDLKKIKKPKYELKCIKYSIYLNYIIDLYEYSFITKNRIQTNKPKNKYYNSQQLIAFVEGGTDKELVVIEQNVNEFLKVVEYIWNLKPQVLQQLQTDNPPKQTNNYREEVHHEKNSSFSMETSQMSTFLIREAGVEKEEYQEEYDEDIEVKPTLYDSLTRQQQKDFKELKTAFLKRDIVLRDSLGAIEKFNINYDPLYSPQFQKVVEKLKSNFLLKEIFYCFQNEKWRDELYNFSPNNVLFGLSKYLTLEKIKNVIAIEKSKCLDKIQKEQNDMNNNKQYGYLLEYDSLKKINVENNIYPNNTSSMLYNSSRSLSLVNNRYKTENLNYLEFKKRFIQALQQNDKNKKKHNESYPYLNLKEDYLVTLYKNVYLNNPEHDFIFKNPSLILNYIFIDISNSGENSKKEENDLILQQKLEEENEMNNTMLCGKRNRKISNVDKYEEQQKISKFSQKNNDNINKELKKSNKNVNDIFDERGQLIISPLLENLQDNNMESSSESVKTEDYTYCYLKFEEKDFKIVSKEIEYIYHFDKKKEKMEPIISIKKIRKNLLKKRTEIKGNKHAKYSLDEEDDNDLNTNKKNTNKNVNFFFERKKEKSGTNFKQKSVKYLGQKLIKYDIPDELDTSDNKNKEKEKKLCCLDKGNKTEINNKFNDYTTNLNNPTESNNNVFKPNTENENITTNNDNNTNKTKSEKNLYSVNKKRRLTQIDFQNYNENIDINYYNKIIKNKKSNDNEDKKYIQKKYFDFDFINDIKNTGNKKTNNKVLNKNKSMKQLNINHNNKQVIQRSKNNNLSVKKNSTVLIKPKTYNFFSPKELKQETENNNKNNKKTINGTKMVNKNYGFKNKDQQEIELVNGAIEYLKNELMNSNNNRNRNNLAINCSLTMGSIPKKYEINNKNNKYQKYSEKKGDESIISLPSTSSELKNNNNYNNKNNVFSGESSTNNDYSNSSNKFQKEMSRIMKFNKKLIVEEKNNGNKGIKYNKILFNNNMKYDFENNKNYKNQRLKKCLSQINFYEKKFDKTENEKTEYSKNKTKSNKYCSPIGNQNSIYYINNKSINNNTKNSSNYTKLNNKTKLSNNKDKFRYVLDKYVIYQKKTRNNQTKQNNKIKQTKEEEKSSNDKKNQKLKMKTTNDAIKHNLEKEENSKINLANDKNIIKNNDEDYNNIDNSEDDDKLDIECNDLGSNTNIKELKNLPYYITPNYSKNISQNESMNKIKSSSNSGNSSFLKGKNKNVFINKI